MLGIGEVLKKILVFFPSDVISQCVYPWGWGVSFEVGVDQCCLSVVFVGVSVEVVFCFVGGFSYIYFFFLVKGSPFKVSFEIGE